MAYTNYMMNQRNDTLSKNISATSDVITRVEKIAECSTKAISAMADKFDDLAGIADKCVSEVKTTNETVKVIKDIALNTRILGFNASIEASKAKESGKGFGVIAQEVRSLADTSKSSADKIESKMKSIAGYAQQIDDSAREARELVDTSIAEMKELKNVIQMLEK